MRVYLLPLLGILYLVWGAWTLGRARRRAHRPPLEWRVGVGCLGALSGWAMANLTYSPDALHRVAGLPLPVFQLVNQAGTWTDQTSPWFVGSLLVDILIFTLLASQVLGLLWSRLQPARARNRG